MVPISWVDGPYIEVFGFCIPKRFGIVRSLTGNFCELLANFVDTFYSATERVQIATDILCADAMITGVVLNSSCLRAALCLPEIINLFAAH